MDIQGTWKLSSLDNGSKIYCRAKGVAVRDNAEMCDTGPLNVLFPPNVQITISAAHQNGSVSFVCSAVSNPVIAGFRWLVDGLKPLDVTNPSKLDNNSYQSSFTVRRRHGRREITCEAWNTLHELGSARTVLRAVTYLSTLPTTTQTFSNNFETTVKNIKNTSSTEMTKIKFDDNSFAVPSSTDSVFTKRKELPVSHVVLIWSLTVAAVTIIVLIVSLAFRRRNGSKNGRHRWDDREKEHSTPLESRHGEPSGLCNPQNDHEMRKIGEANAEEANGNKRIISEPIENESNESSNTSDGVVFAKVNEPIRYIDPSAVIRGIGDTDDESIRCSKNELCTRVRQPTETNWEIQGPFDDIVYAKVDKPKRKDHVQQPAEIIEMGETNDEYTCAQKERCIPQAMENDRNQLSDVQHDDIYAKVKKPKRKGRANQPADEVTTISETKDVSTRGQTERCILKAIQNDSGGPSDDGHHDVVYAKVNKPKRQDLVHQQAECSIASSGPFDSQENGVSAHMAGGDQGEKTRQLRNIEGLVYADLDFRENSVRREQDCPLPLTLRRESPVLYAEIRRPQMPKTGDQTKS